MPVSARALRPPALFWASWRWLRSCRGEQIGSSELSAGRIEKREPSDWVHDRRHLVGEEEVDKRFRSERPA